jgi:hypothetical protein
MYTNTSYQPSQAAIPNLSINRFFHPEETMTLQEKNWLSNAIKIASVVHDPQWVRINLFNHTKALRYFTPEQVIFLIDKTREFLSKDNKYPIGFQVIISNAIINISKNLASYHPLLSKNTQKLQWLVIELIKERVSDLEEDPYDLMRKYKIPWNAKTYEGHLAILALAEASMDHQPL